jgi:error-prone DNA polymerase
VTDRAGVYGIPRFHKAAKEAGVEAIVGAEAVLADGGRLPLLVRDARGYSNLCRLLTTAALHGLPPPAPGVGGGRAPSPEPRSPGKGGGRVPWDLLGEHASGLIALTGGENGPLLRALAEHGEDAARHVLHRMVLIYGGKGVAVEVQRHLRRGEDARNAVLVRLARELDLPVVATQDALFAAPEDGALADVFTCLREKCTLDTAGRRLEVNRARHLRSGAAMARLFADLPEAIANTALIAERCAFRLSQLPYRFPSARLEQGRDEAQELRARVHAGGRERYREPSPRVLAQLERELALIEKLGLCGYFLVVHDIVRFCRSRGILAQGRGSAANSVVCYSLSITAVDPIAMELLFERFLSEERGEWPDIDIDLPSGDRREEVIQHVYRSYGERGAAMTANVITYRGRSAVREVGKALGFAPAHLDKLSSLLGGWGGFEGEPRAELAAHLRTAGLAPEERRAQLFVDLVTRVLRLPRHLGQHSGGMVLAHGRLDDVVPLEPASMPGRVVIQWDKDDCADLGIIKVDLLGLGMLAVLEEVVPLIREHEGVEVDLAHLPADDPKVYGMLCKADTVGVFQVESRAQMATLPRMRPSRFYDLVVEVAIIRPGPIVGKMVSPYLERRAGRQPVVYPHPDLEPILKRTLGVPLFQEQLMRIAMVAAGFTGGQAEELRRAMAAKRSVERMRAMEKQLRDGMAVRGITGAGADLIVQGITSFALYGFPESHAASFALIAYASAYLKAYHPVAFLCALLNGWPMGFYHPATLVQDGRRHGVAVLPIDVNASQWTCRLEEGGSWFVDRGSTHPPTPAAGGASQGERNSRAWAAPAIHEPRTTNHVLAVRLGLRYVKGLREEPGRRIAEEAAAAPFASVQEVARRCRLRADELEALALVGAFASLGATRRSALWQVSALDGRRPPLAQAMQPNPAPSPLPEMTREERYVADYRGAGVTVGAHPLVMRRRELLARGILSAAELQRRRNGERVRIGGVVIVRQRPATAKGMCFATIEDETGLANVVFMPDFYRANRSTITGHALLEVEGIVQSRDGVITVRTDAARPLFLDDTPATPSRDFH